jgi:hypothetical protein
MPKGEAGPVPPHVQDVLARLNRVGQGLAEISSRAREASKRALQLALDVHGMVADAQRELESMPASAQRDAALLEVVHLPIHLRRRAQEVRDESVRLPVRSYEMRAQLQRTVSRRTLGRRRTIPLPPLR